ncbi:uncharacterized protein LOC109823336 [Asparagus officinalis]|uniref:uncharacterized protein LOC109823336 n=1 Tax=Asparagus officinalis TaxID=4686 RepID=UPI00098E168D|nr:uncharacterized protein LOC109823336 [Asparagus officinalis]
MSNLGLNCEKMHACPNDCVLYWKENSYKKECPTCGVCTYKKKAHISKNNIPLKVVRYFPITQRLQRLYKYKKTVVAMTWHDRALPREDGKMSHPRDSPAWKNFDKLHLIFSQDPRNIRLRLASDGFCPFSFNGNPHSTWPVVMMIYNLSPWLVMDQSYFIMPLLIDGPSSSGNNISVYLQLLIEELRSLFIDGVETYDADQGETFIMRAASMWTINKFPAYGMLSGYSVHGYKACPHCHMDTISTWLPFSKKICYCGHQRMLKEDHLYRDDDVHFDGTTEHRKAPVPLSGADILAQWNDYENVIFGKVKERQEKPQGWNKKNIFFELPYWVTNTVHHNLDIMHIEKGVSEHIFNLLLFKDGKSKDNLQARRDLQHFNIRKELHPIPKLGKLGKFVLPNAIYHMSKLEKKIFLEVLHELKVPTGFSGSFNKKIKTVKGKIDGELCAKTIKDKELEKLQEAVPLILCKLERIFPPTFFDIIIHLTVHLATEARLAGPYNVDVTIHVENRIYKDELHEEHHNWNDERLEKHHQENFCAWFKNYVQDPNSELTLDDDLRCLARHPSLEVAYYKGFGINGYKFEIKEIEESQTTQNSGIVAIGDEGWSVVCRWKPRDTYDVPQFANVDIEDNIEIDSDDEGL